MRFHATWLPEMIMQRVRRTRGHVIADLSVNHVERFVLRCGHVPRRMNPDYGIDLYMETYNSRGEIENEGVWFQLRASDRWSVARQKQAIPVRMEWRHLLFWLNERMPGILVAYDARQDRACWLHIQEAARGLETKRSQRPSATVTLYVPLTQALDESAVRRFARLRDAAIGASGD